MSATERTVKELKWAKERLSIKDDEIQELQGKIKRLNNTLVIVAFIWILTVILIIYYLMK